MGMTTMDAADLERELVAAAAAVGPVLEAHAEQHDRDGTFVTEGFEAVRDAGLLAIGVPAELGGRGATIRQVAMVQRELARHCASTALATSMHQHSVGFAAWRFRRGMPGAEALLRRVVEEGAVIVSTGGADFTRPRGTATKVDGGYRVSGHKVFASQSPVGTVLNTLFPYEDPEQGLRALSMGVPVAAEGVRVLDNWDTLGMRGTGSNDVILEDVFVPDAAVGANRPHGVLDPPLQVIACIAMGIVSAVYLGVAEAAREHALLSAATKADDPTVQRQVGLMTHRIRVAGWALDGALAEIGDDPQPSMATCAAAFTAKRENALAGLEVCDLAIEVGGGAAFFKGSPLERAYRDMRAIKFHPLTPEATLLHAGQVALGLPADNW
jgi:alkylation response protein AidB-like acyl-CoA dehydrogenase